MKGMSGYLVVVRGERGQLRYAIMVYGAQSVTTGLVPMKLKWFAQCWDMILLVCQ